MCNSSRLPGYFLGLGSRYTGDADPHRVVHQGVTGTGVGVEHLDRVGRVRQSRKMSQRDKRAARVK